MVNLQVLGEVAKVIVSVLLGSLIGYLVAKRTFSYQLWKQEAKTFYLNAMIPLQVQVSTMINFIRRKYEKSMNKEGKIANEVIKSNSETLELLFNKFMRLVEDRIINNLLIIFLINPKLANMIEWIFQERKTFNFSDTEAIKNLYTFLIDLYVFLYTVDIKQIEEVYEALLGSTEKRKAVFSNLLKQAKI